MVQSDLIVQLYNRNKSCQKCHYKQHWYHDQPSRMHRSPPRSCQNWLRKIQRFEKSDTDISDLIIQCFNRDESYQKLYLKQLVTPW